MVCLTYHNVPCGFTVESFRTFAAATSQGSSHIHATLSCYCTGLSSEPNSHHLHQIARAYLLKIIAAGFVNILSEKRCGDGH